MFFLFFNVDDHFCGSITYMIHYPFLWIINRESYKFASNQCIMFIDETGLIEFVRIIFDVFYLKRNTVAST